MTKRDPRFRAFVKVDRLGQVVPGSLIIRKKYPARTSGYWQEIVPNVCCPTTTSTSTSTTTTTTAP